MPPASTEIQGASSPVHRDGTLDGENRTHGALAQSGSAPRSQRGGRGFKSHRFHDPGWLPGIATETWCCYISVRRGWELSHFHVNRDGHLGGDRFRLASLSSGKASRGVVSSLNCRKNYKCQHGTACCFLRSGSVAAVSPRAPFPPVLASSRRDAHYPA